MTHTNNSLTFKLLHSRLTFQQKIKGVRGGGGGGGDHPPPLTPLFLTPMQIVVVVVVVVFGEGGGERWAGGGGGHSMHEGTYPCVFYYLVVLSVSSEIDQS